MAIKFGRPLERSRLAPAEVKAERLDLAVRLRRNRKSEWSRRMMRENVLTPDDLIWPLFIVEGTQVRAPVESMPDVERLSVDQAVRAAERAASLAIPRRISTAIMQALAKDPDERPQTAGDLARLLL